ncbi:old yellow enzyme (OYE)-related FMN binding domain-containing protein [Malaciobacter marinus]|uniref:Alkene reductase n=1 Tax=Malaciobacter marinus TaxID=505249 RepID=A0A347TKB7_9BACT|nr:alkene reductase [Malaciobacter marinus]AXX87045.1 old yellow enzyme (OYE)-related FMN binding domain-containing protein [Malaciobacter marinus]PHO14601.1 alkene reductase [Malaciobacter marinus]
MKNIFESYKMNNIHLKNRVLMAPMTRSRSAKGEVPTQMNANYYAQRASAGIIITEATQISKQGQGYADTPGIYTKEQIEGWKKVTKAVHDKGGKIILQLWHVGRVSSSKVNKLQPIGPSPLIAKDTQVYIFDTPESKDATMIPVEQPREMTTEDISQVIEEFTTAAENAIEAGFDGVEIHGANGYLIDQFLRSNSNIRDDKYGGSKENRINLLLEITKAVIAKIGSEKTGVRLSPFIKFKDMDDPEMLDTFMLAAKELNKLDILYIHLCEADWDDAPKIPESFRNELRKTFKNTIIATGGYTLQRANDVIKKDLVDLVGFGRYFIPNPDLVSRLENNYPLSEIKDSHTLFGGRDEYGYSDYSSYKD